MSRTNEQIIEHIKHVLKTHVAPAVAQHGGKINFVSYDDGALLLELSGSCAGCAGSKMTLKLGVERLLKEDVPEIEVVEAVDDEDTDATPYFTEEDLDEPDKEDV